MELGGFLEALWFLRPGQAAMYRTHCIPRYLQATVFRWDFSAATNTLQPHPVETWETATYVQLSAFFTTYLRHTTAYLPKATQTQSLGFIMPSTHVKPSVSPPAGPHTARILTFDSREPRVDCLWRRILSCYRFEVDSDGNLNPTLLEIAKHGHYVETQVLEIPERWRLFDTTNPRLQARQAAGLAVFVANVAVFASMQITSMIYFYFYLPFLKFLGLSAFFLSLVLGFTALVWLLMVDCGRRTDHVWTDWKAREE